MNTVKPQFEYFDDPVQRAMIAETGFRVAQYAKDEQIGSLVLVDRAARNLHIPVRAAYGELAPDEPVPGTYFLNPTGFLSPELHTDIDYSMLLIQEAAEATGMTEKEIMLRFKSDPELALQLQMQAHLRGYEAALSGGRTRVAQQLTPLIGKVIQRDETFNGRVLVLDACLHHGGSLRGIAHALQDVGVIDVRTGVVNNIRNKTGHRPDFVVFNDDEIEDNCKPFGPQDGLVKGGEFDMLSFLKDDGLSEESKLARQELRAIMKNGAELREDFTRYANRRGNHQIGTFNPQVLAMIQRLNRAERDRATASFPIYSASDYMGYTVLSDIEVEYLPQDQP